MRSRDEEDEHRVLARAHVAERRRPLPVAGEAGGGQRVERHPLRPAGEHRLRDAGPAVERLDRPDVLVLARVGGGHDRDLGRVERPNASIPPASMSATRPNGLTVDRRVTTRSGSPTTPDDPAGRVDLHDVAPMLALDDPVADLADEHRRGRG